MPKRTEWNCVGRKGTLRKGNEREGKDVRKGKELLGDEWNYAEQNGTVWRGKERCC